MLPHADNQFSYYEFLPRAKTLQDRQEAQPISVHPLKPLPQYMQSNIGQEETEVPHEAQQGSSGKVFTCSNTKLAEIFKQPIYKSNPKLIMSESNYTFGQLKCKLKQSQYELPRLESRHTPTTEMQFESRFQSGNLAIVSKQSENEFNLLIQKDINTNSCTQWFFFCVRNNQQTGVKRFNILNFTKSYSAYDNGMAICIFSKKQYEENNKGWHRGCIDIEYAKNNITRGSRTYFTLSFSYDFKSTDDEVYFSHCYPYTYSRLQRFLHSVEEKHPKILHRRRLAHSLCGNFIQMISISNFTDRDKIKPVIFVTARVHPGQTLSSFVCQGLINYLLSDAIEAENLRRQFVFKICPMLNPDGVIHGNYRCSLFGCDLNRQWKQPDKQMLPEIYAIKKMMEESIGERLAYFDLHGHSKKRGVFTYGCRNRSNPYECRQIPFLFHKLLSSFNYYNCNFNVTKVREGTARVAVWKDFRITHSYTLECSFFGPSTKYRCNFVKKDYKEIGQGLARVLANYFCRRQHSKTINGRSQELHEVLQQLYSNNEMLNIGNNPSEGSSSAQSLEEPEEQQKLPMNTQYFQPTKSNKQSLVFLNTHRTPNRERISRITSNQFYRPKRFQRTGRMEEDQSHRLTHTGQWMVPKPTNFKVPSIHELKMQGKIESSNAFRPHIEYIRRSSQPHNSMYVDALRKQAQSTQSYVNTKFDMGSIILPSSLRNQYTNYQRYRRQEIDLNLLLSSEAGAIRSKQMCETKKQWFTPRSIIEKVKNKKEIRSVSRRPERRLKQRTIGLL